MSEGGKRKAGQVETIDLSDSDSVLEESPSSSAKKPHCDSKDVVFLDSDSNDDKPKVVLAEESEPVKQDRLVKEFILITKTDSKVASYFLEQHNWQLEVRIPTH
jgi:UBA-like domain